MNIKKFQITDDGFEWDDIAHDNTIRFVLGDNRHLDCRIETDRRGRLILCVTGESRESDELVAIPRSSNSFHIAFRDPLRTK